MRKQREGGWEGKGRGGEEEGKKRELDQLACVGNWHKNFFRKWFKSLLRNTHTYATHAIRHVRT